MNQRRRTRVEPHKPVTVEGPSGTKCTGEVANLSLKGCLVRPAEGDLPRPDDAVRVVIHLEPGTEAFDVCLHGRVVRVGGGVAVDFTGVPPESFPHLFRLVQYNAPDPEGIESELGCTAFDPAQNLEDSPDDPR